MAGWHLYRGADEKQGGLEHERRARRAMELATSQLLTALEREHPRIVRALQLKNNCK